MYFPFFKPQSGGKRFAAQPQTIYSEFPEKDTCERMLFMNFNALPMLAETVNTWTPPLISGPIPHGDMPGDKVQIGPEHIAKANTIFPALVPMAAELAQNGRVVITVCGGSGVGKSEIASLLSHYFRTAGVGSYTLSGDNYPKRIPMYNDAERNRIFRAAGLRGLVEAGVYDEAVKQRIRHIFDTVMRDDEKGKELQADGSYADRHLNEPPLNSQELFYDEAYRAAGRAGEGI